VRCSCDDRVGDIMPVDDAHPIKLRQRGGPRGTFIAHDRLPTFVGSRLSSAAKNRQYTPAVSFGQPLCAGPLLHAST